MRFTMKTMMVATIVASVICAIFFALPGWLSVCMIGLFWLFAPPVLIAGLVYGRGYGRAFCVGCVSTGGCLPILYLYLLMAMFSGFEVFEAIADEETAAFVKIYSGVIFVLIGMSGLLAMSVRWFSLRMAKSTQQASGIAAPYTVIHGRVSAGTLESETYSPDAGVAATSPSSASTARMQGGAP